MSVGLLLITHEDLGRVVLRQAQKLTGGFVPAVELIEVAPDDDPRALADAAADKIRQLDTGDGVLVITDMFGATPSNIAHHTSSDCECVVVHGLNLAMLMRAHNYADLALDELVQKVLEGGHRSIFAGDPG